MTSKVVAVTGGIGSGKSEVCRYLQSLGYQTLDCDVLAREVSVRSNTVEQVRKLLGDDYIDNGQLNRALIRNRVFADKKVLSQYNAIFFAEVKALLDERLSKLNGVVFVEISVFDAFEYPWDEVWLVEANANNRIDRAMARDGSSREILQNIVNSQHICEVFTLKILNNGNLEELRRKVDDALTTLKFNIIETAID